MKEEPSSPLAPCDCTRRVCCALFLVLVCLVRQVSSALASSAFFNSCSLLVIGSSFGVGVGRWRWSWGGGGVRAGALGRGWAPPHETRRLKYICCTRRKNCDANAVFWAWSPYERAFQVRNGLPCSNSCVLPLTPQPFYPCIAPYFVQYIFQKSLILTSPSPPI